MLVGVLDLLLITMVFCKILSYILLLFDSDMKQEIQQNLFVLFLYKVLSARKVPVIYNICYKVHKIHIK